MVKSCRIIAIFFTLSLISTYALAAPVGPVVTGVSGSVSNGLSFQLFGNNFGLKPQVNPLRYEQFEFGQVYDKVSVGGYWQTRESKPEMQISTEQVRPGGTRSAKTVLTTAAKVTTRADKAWKNNVGFASTGKIYLNYWIYWDWGWATADTDNFYQIKALNLGDYDDGAADMYPSMYMMGWQNYKYQSEPENPSVYGYTYWHYNPNSSTTTVDPGGSLYIKHAPSFSSQHNTIGRTPGWYNFIAQVDLGTPGVANGNAKFWVTSPTGQAYSYGEVTNAKLLSATSNYYDAVRLGWYQGSTPEGSSTLYYDDIYIDNSFARVEIGDNNQYDQCTLREIQFPTSWSQERIELTVNTGFFQTGKTVYFFVIDANGNPSQGYGPLTIVQPPPVIIQIKTTN